MKFQTLALFAVFFLVLSAFTSAWANTSFQTKQQIFLSNNNATNQTPFIVWIPSNDSIFNGTLFYNSSENGAFTLPSFMVNPWQSNGGWWVRVENLYTEAYGNQSIYKYNNSASTVGMSNESNSTGVWPISLLGEYSFRNGTDWLGFDGTGNQNNFTQNSNQIVANSSGQFGNAVQTSEKNFSIAPAGFKTMNGGASVSFWFYLNGTDSTGGPTMDTTNASSNVGWQFLLMNTGPNNFNEQFFTSGGDCHAFGTIGMKANTWHEFTGVMYTNGTCVYYLDGRANMTATITAGGLLPPARIYLGNDNTVTANRGYVGLLDELRIWNTTLSGEYVGDDYNLSIVSLGPVTQQPAGLTLNSNSSNTTNAGYLASFVSSWTAGNGLDNWTFEYDNGNGTLYNTTPVQFTGTTNETNASFTLNSTIGSTIRWQFFVNDSGTLTSATPLNSFKTTASAPDWQGQSNNQSFVNKLTLFNVNWSDGLGLVNYTFSFDNGTGTFVNYSNQSMTGLYNSSNFTTTIGMGVIRYQVYAWNLQGVMNVTPIFQFSSTSAPQFYNSTVNTTDASTDALYSVNISDFSGLSYYVFELDNGTGTLRNYTNVSTNAISGVVSFQSVLPVSGSVIRWQWFAVNNNTIMNATTMQTFTTRGYTLQAFDEGNGGPLVFNVTVSNGTQSVTLTNQTNGVITGSLPLGLDTFSFTAFVGGYTTRNYQVSVPFTGNVAVNAYLLQTSQGQNVVYIITGSGGGGIQGASIVVQKLIGNNLVVVAQGTTDFTGSVGVFLNPTTIYTLTFSATGYVSQSETASQPYTLYTIKLAINGGSNQTVSGGTNVTYGFFPSGNTLNSSNQTQQIIFTINDPASMLQSFALAIYFNGSQIGFVNVTNQPSGGSILFTINNTLYSSYSGTNNLLTAVAMVSGVTNNQAYFFNNSITWAFGQVTAQPGSLADALNQAAGNKNLQLPLLILALILAIVIGTALAPGSPMGAFIGLGVIAVFMFAGIFTNSQTGLIDFQAWGVYVIGVLFTLALAYLRGQI